MDPDDEHEHPLLSSASEDETVLENRRRPIYWRLWDKFYGYIDGPRPRQYPEVYVYFPTAQKRVDKFVNQLGSSKRIFSFWLCFYTIWFLSFGWLVYVSSFSAHTDDSGDPPVFISCATSLWGVSNQCGLNGQDCEPFDGTTFDFRCPAACRSTVVLNYRTIGDQVIIHRPLVIGGQGAAEGTSGIYRADSFICASAIHAGMITDRYGGCGRLETRGQQDSFEGSLAHGIDTLSFDSEFPKSYSFRKLNRMGGCADLRWEISGFNAVFSSAFALLQSSSLLFYWVLFIVIYAHVALVSDPPPRVSWELLSVAFKGLLPSLFVGYAFWKAASRWTLDQAAPFDRTLFWLGGLWFGALLNYIAIYIPISRLQMSDITRDGGIFWLIGLIILIVAIAIGQMRIMRKAGDLVYYLKVYLTGLCVLICLALIPGLTLRIHHYIFAILFVPGTAYKTRMSMLYQGILIGLFLDGIGRWGMDSILETREHLREDGAFGSLVPSFIDTANWHDRQEIGWIGDLPANYDYSVLVNEVERYRGRLPAFEPAALGRLLDHVPYYVRVAYALGQNAFDYSETAIFYANGTFIAPKGHTSQV